MTKLQIKTDNDKKTKWEIINDVFEDIGFGSQGIIINHQYHVIGGDQCKHLSFNKVSNKLDVLHDFRKRRNYGMREQW